MEKVRYIVKKRMREAGISGRLDLRAGVRRLQDHALRPLQGLPAQEVVHGAVVGDPRGLRLPAQHKAPVFRLPHVGGRLGHSQACPVFDDLDHGSAPP